ncbi:MAG: isoprenylcysteine carboxylmethyltransferase family protein [Acetobacteraceae bacterium]|nr:isoprenylcysteine carboxylmethyltransferase family protein [Acetobacteraceae bacterium]
MDLIAEALLFVAGGLGEQFIKYGLGLRGKLHGTKGFRLGYLLEVACYFPVGSFVIWRVLATRQFPQLAHGVPLAAGAILVLLGAGINYAAVRELKVSRWNSAPVYGVAEGLNNLVTTGLYAYVRHPSYLGQIIMFAGCAVLVPSPYVVTFAVTFALYTVFIHAKLEDHYLRERFGEEYIRYAAQVPGFLPLRRGRR